jgi:hypothetical protein
MNPSSQRHIETHCSTGCLVRVDLTCPTCCLVRIDITCHRESGVDGALGPIPLHEWRNWSILYKTGYVEHRGGNIVIDNGHLIRVQDLEADRPRARAG